MIADIIATKMDAIMERVRRLNLYTKNMAFNKFITDMKTKDAVERNLQVALQSCLDIGKMIIKEEGFRQPEDNKGVFVILAENGLISKSSLDFLIPMAGTRNVLVHGYDRVDDETIYGIIKKKLTDFEKFQAEIKTNYLDRIHGTTPSKTLTFKGGGLNGNEK